jgi:hypothetical protein
MDSLAEPYVWVFEQYGREMKVQVEGQLCSTLSL